MTKPRKLIMSLDQTAWYHCYVRAVRRGWLFGEDKLTGKDYSHRKVWVTDKLAELADIFANNLGIIWDTPNTDERPRIKR